MSANVQLGEFLRARRAEVSPESVGLAHQGSYRRVAGLRREEVAQLAGVSTDYYTRLEQGRHLSPSDSVLDAIATVLGLDSAGRKHLADLARASRTRTRGGVRIDRQQVRPGLLRLLETLDDHAAFVLGRRTDVLAANRLARALLADFHVMPARERNLTRWILLDPAAKTLYRDWRTIASEMVAILRLEAGRHPEDPRTTDLEPRGPARHRPRRTGPSHRRRRGAGRHRTGEPVTTARPDNPATRPLALVTGASNGIGLEIARDLARRGYDLVVTGRSPRTDEVADELRGLGVDAYPVRADLAEYDAVEALWKSVLELRRPVDVAVLNAGVGIGGAFADIDLAEDLKLVDLNVKSVVHLAKRVVVDMIPRGRGWILMTASISATQPTPYETTYGPSRAFVYMFAEGLRAEVREHGITVTALLPGATDSDFHVWAGMGDTKFSDNSWKNDKRLVARQGIDALLAGKDHVVGGDRATKRKAFLNRFIPERVKAERHARRARPAS